MRVGLRGIPLRPRYNGPESGTPARSRTWLRALASCCHGQGGQRQSYLAPIGVTTGLEGRKTRRFRLLRCDELSGFNHCSVRQDDGKKLLALAVHFAVELGNKISRAGLREVY